MEYSSYKYSEGGQGRVNTWLGFSLELKKKGRYGTCCPGKSDVNETLIMSRLVPVGNTSCILDSQSTRGISDGQELVDFIVVPG